MEELVAFSNHRRNRLLDVFGMRNPRPRMMKRKEDEKKAGAVVLPRRYERVETFGLDVISYLPDRHYHVGVYITQSPLSEERSYFEVEILDHGANRCIAVGLVPYHYPLNAQPGWRVNSVGYHADDGRLYKGAGHGMPFGPKCRKGDRMGCGIRFEDRQDQYAIVFFTRNGSEIGKTKVKVPPGGFHPAVGMHSEGEEVQLHLQADWETHESMQMAVDHCEDDWKRLHDVRLCGQVGGWSVWGGGWLLEYTGRGRTIHDVGLAQATHALSTACHYFEMEIVDPGDSCYIAIGIAKRDYPKHRHPGWNKESVAYHADDGKVFMGSGIGDPFGPRCYKGDTMGCGIFFPLDYHEQLLALQAQEEEEDEDDPLNNDLEGRGFHDDDDEDELDADRGVDSDEEEFLEPPPRRDAARRSIMVDVFFTRNGKMVGQRKVAVPRGGFYPTVGMLSSCERVRVDLHPVTG
ncbi:hypothetical protein ACOMHN_058527 [Nucella lapillus]